MGDPIFDSAVALPAPALRPFITRYGGFRATGVQPTVHMGLPSTDVHLIISLGPPIDVIRMPNAAQRPTAFSALVSGLQNAPAMVRQGTEAHGLHVFLNPAGVRALLGVASAELSSLVVHLSDIWGNGAHDLLDALIATDSWQERFSILDRAFLASLDRAFLARLGPVRIESEVAWAWRALEKTHGAVPVQLLANDIGWSRRHFSDRFRDVIGVTPKSAARLFRFQRACRVILDQRPSLAQVAASCGYFDQAHMTREWQALAGCSPRAWIAHQLPFIQDYEVGGCDNEPYEPDSIYQSFV